MATVKEVKLMKNGAMVTPVVLADSIKNLDGTNYKDYVSSSINNLNTKITNLENSKAGFPSGDTNDMPIGSVIIVKLRTSEDVINHTYSTTIYKVIDDSSDYKGGFVTQAVKNYGVSGTATQLNGTWYARGCIAPNNSSSVMYGLFQRVS